MAHSAGKWEIGTQESAVNTFGDIIIDKPVIRITTGRDQKWVALLGNPNNKEVQDNAKLISAAPDLLDAAKEVYMRFVADLPTSEWNEMRDKLFRAIQKATV